MYRAAGSRALLRRGLARLRPLTNLEGAPLKLCLGGCLVRRVELAQLQRGPVDAPAIPVLG